MAQLELRGLSGDEVTSAMNQLKASLQQGAGTAPEALIAHIREKPKAQAYWRPQDGLWETVEFHATSGKFICTYGTIDRVTRTKQPTVCAINVRMSEPWNPMGAFATEGKKTYYAHWGKNKGGNDFASRYGGQRARIHWDDHEADYLVVATLGGKQAASSWATTLMRSRASEKVARWKRPTGATLSKAPQRQSVTWMYGSVALTLKERRRRRLTRADSSRLAIRARLNLMCGRCGRG